MAGICPQMTQIDAEIGREGTGNSTQCPLATTKLPSPATYLTNNSIGYMDLNVYSINKGNQRTVFYRSGVSNNWENQVNYTYDPIGQITSDVSIEEWTGSPRLNEQLSYGYDPAGNLIYRTNNALVQNFNVNSDNELTTATNGGTLTVVGSTTATNPTVTVNGINALIYGDGSFAAAGMPLATEYTAIATGGGLRATNTVSVSLTTNSSFQYDANGNLTNDGLRSFSYDDENQLIQVWVNNQWKSAFSHDGKMRRRIRQEYAWQGRTWVQTNAVYYVYDANLVIQERDINNLPAVTYTRGRDLSGGLEGAGGIGGLLARTAPSAILPSAPSHSYYHADANGNITMLINASQAVVAQYLYDAFGNVLSKSGPLADANLYRFSSKEAHLNSGLDYYLYRYYDANLQRWPNRDPKGELGFELLRKQPIGVGDTNLYRFANKDPLGKPGFRILITQNANLLGGGKNLYVYLQNDSIDYIDPFGLSCWSCFKNTMASMGEPLTSLDLGLMVACIGGCGAVSGGVGVVPGVLGCAAVILGSNAVGIALGCGCY
jgi:RHS repeat-associated protein